MSTNDPDPKFPKAPGPVFIAGRQHSGNSLLTMMIRQLPGCFAIVQEGTFFSNRWRGDGIADDAERARWAAESMRLDDDANTDRPEEMARLATDARQWLPDWVANHPGADALTLYREGMRRATEVSGNDYWVQKATGYIFYAREILRDMPDARIIYLIRNPYDISASILRRQEAEALVGPSVAWNRGLRIACELHEQHPDRFRPIRYESLVTDPEQTAREICEFLGLPYDASILDVPHINPSEAKYQAIQGSRGINKSRLNYYPTILSKAQIAAVSLVVNQSLLGRYYTDLPHQQTPQRWRDRAMAPLLVAKGFVAYAISRVQFARRLNDPLIRRTLRRLRG